MNRVTLCGRLGKAPDLKTLPSGQTVARLRLATNEIGPKKPDGTREKRTEWHTLTAWGKTAELAGKYLAKGSEVLIEGRLQTREWEKDGTKRYSTEVVVDRLEFVGSRPSQSTASAAANLDEPMNYDDVDSTPF